jgi:hypothetical protein
VPIRRFNPNGFQLSLWIDNPKGNEIGIRNTVCGCASERIFVDSLEGAPEVDDLITSFEEIFSFGGEIEWYAARGKRVGIVDMYTICWCGEDLS